nr:MAK10-like protein [Tanacetum cinerariifolium]
MGNENPICTLGDYSKPSHEGYRNTIELPEWNNVVPLRSDTIWLVQNGCSLHELQSEDPNQHLMDLLKLVDSLDLDVANRETTRLRLFQFSFRNQASNWLERILEGSISTWEDLTTCFLAQFFPMERTAKLLQIFYNHVNPTTRRTIDKSAGGKLYDRNAKESCALLEDLALYDNESWNDPRDFAKLLKAISLPQDVSSTSDRRLIKVENQVQHLIEAHLAPKQHVQVNKISSSYGIKSYPVGIVRDVEFHIRRLKLLNDFYVIDMKKDPETLLLVGRGILATANAVTDSRKAKIAIGEGITRSVFGVKETDPGQEEAPY